MAPCVSSSPLGPTESSHGQGPAGPSWRTQAPLPTALQLFSVQQGAKPPEAEEKKPQSKGFQLGKEANLKLSPQSKASQGDAGREARLLKGLHQQPFHRLQIRGRLGFIFFPDRKLAADPAPAGSSSDTTHTQPPWAPPRAFRPPPLSPTPNLLTLR